MSENDKQYDRKQQVKVSVIVPVYNVETYLPECMDSLIHQTLKEIEIICVNDGSTDRSLELLEIYAAKDARIRVINKKNSGYGHTMNVGIDAASGLYIGIAEPDDYVQTGMYERLYELARPWNLDIIKADFYRFEGKGDAKKFEYHALSKNPAYYRKVINPRQHVEIFRFIMNTWTGIYRSDFLRKHQIRHNETPGASFQDNGFWFQSFCWAKRVYFLDEPYYMYRKDNPGSSVHSRQKVYSACEEYEYIHKFLDAHPDLKKKYLYIYSLKRFHNYQFTMNRIGKEYYHEFLQRDSKDFREAEANGELSREYFTNSDWRILHEIIDSPDKYAKRFRKKGNIWYKVRYYLENYGWKRTVVKITEQLRAEVCKYGKSICNRTRL